MDNGNANGNTNYESVQREMGTAQRELQTVQRKLENLRQNERDAIDLYNKLSRDREVAHMQIIDLQVNQFVVSRKQICLRIPLVIEFDY